LGSWRRVARGPGRSARPLSRLVAGGARFGVVGITGVLVNSLILLLAHGIAGLPLLLASPLAVEVAILHNYLWNDRWTFRSQGFSALRLAKFNLASLGGMVVASGTLYLLAERWGFPYLLANLVGVAAASILNFSASLLWIWGSE